MSGSGAAVPWLRKRTLAVSVLPLRRNSVTSATTPGHFVSSRASTPAAGAPAGGAAATGAAAGAVAGATVAAAGGAAAEATMPGAAVGGGAVAAGRASGPPQAAETAKPNATTPAAFQSMGGLLVFVVPPSYTARGGQATSGRLVVDDPQEGFGLQAGAADESAVDVGLGHEPVDVVGLDAATVEDPHRGRRRLSVGAGDALADDGVDLLGLGGSGGAAGADGPHRLVGDEDAAGLVEGEGTQRALELPLHDLQGPVGLALGQRLADADDGRQALIDSRPHLSRHHLLALAEDMAPLRVAEDHVAAADVLQHQRGDLAREGALALPVHVLRAEQHPAAAERLGDRAERGEGGRHQHVAVREGKSQAGADLLGQRDRLPHRLVHLPITR